MTVSLYFIYFFFKYTATTVIYTLSLHDALPIFLAFWGTKLLILWGPQQIPRLSDVQVNSWVLIFTLFVSLATGILTGLAPALQRSEEHTSELQSLAYLVCRLLLEKKKKQETILI